MSNSKIQDPRSKILFIVGPTASGKSGLAMRVANEFNGEIICADSQTVRKGLNIGTAKPTLEEREMVKHHLLDVVEPYERFTVAQFKELAESAIEKISESGRLPIVVGGSGLYIDSLLYDFSFRGEAEAQLRAELEKKSVDELQKMIKARNLKMPENLNNPRHLIRVIESAGKPGSSNEHREDALVVGIDPGKDELEKRIELRVKQMIDSGFLDEVESVLDEYGFPPSDFDAIGYKIALSNRNDNGDYNKEKIVQEFIIADRQYAKRQRTWFKRNKNIQWLTDADVAFEYIAESL